MTSRMKTSLLVVTLLSLLIPSSRSGKHLLLETVDKNNADTDAVAPIEDSDKAGSDYMQSYCQYLPGGCKPKVFARQDVLVIPLESNDEGGYDVSRANSICRGSSRHGAPCTT